MTAHATPLAPPARRLSRRPAGFTLAEVTIALTVATLVLAGLAAQMIEAARLNHRITASLEHGRNARELIDTVSRDVRSAQIARLYPGFTNRSEAARDGQRGNYLVLDFLDSNGTIVRTIGYYALPLPDAAGWGIYRHDSADGSLSPGSLPATGTAGSHRLIKRALRLGTADTLFRCARDRGIALEGEFVSPDVRGTARADLIRATVLTRS
ncbi:MAG: hypothetical protein D6781_06570 [Verrucomicrobia bacterium]|nr:MAG: hypothetical protein D6781_06570 [Verrucomicrobiota bacterium]